MLYYLGQELKYRLTGGRDLSSSVVAHTTASGRGEKEIRYSGKGNSLVWFKTKSLKLLDSEMKYLFILPVMQML